MTNGDISSIGLWLDVIGAFFLAESFVMKRRTEIARESGSYFDGNPFLLRSASYQAVEARTGFTFIAVGFLAQLVSQAGWLSPEPARWPWALAGGALALFVVAFVVVRRLGRRFSRRMVAREWAVMIDELQNPNHSPDRLYELACFYGVALDLEPDGHETASGFTQRVIRNPRNWGATPHACEP